MRDFANQRLINFFRLQETKVELTLSKAKGRPRNVVIVKDGPEEPTAEMIRADLQKFVDAVDTAILVDLPERCWIALVDFCYTVGCEAFASHPIVGLINAGRMKEASQEFMAADDDRTTIEMAQRHANQRAMFIAGLHK